MNEYERKLINAAKAAIESLGIDPNNVSSDESLWIKSYIMGAADDSHVDEIYGEAAASDYDQARIAGVQMFRGARRPLTTALLKPMGDQLQPFEDKAIAELSGDGGAELRETVARDHTKRYRDVDCEAREAGL